MSSLAAAQADGYYHPPDYDPRRHGGLSKFQGSKGSSQWERHGVIRFELPYNAWCLGCRRAIGQGTRYNAKKVPAGKYFSTTIWEFQMKCATCPQRFVIRTDPKARDYDFVSGIRRVRSTPSAESAEQTELASDDTKRELATNALFSLEHREEDKRKARAEKTRLSSLLRRSEVRRDDDYAANQRLRVGMRKRRRTSQKLAAEGEQAGLPYALLPSSREDRAAASAVMLRREALGSRSARRDPFRTRETRRKREVLAESIFGGGGGGGGGEAGKKTKAARKRPRPGSAAATAEYERRKLLALDEKRRRMGGVRAKDLRVNRSGGDGSAGVPVAALLQPRRRKVQQRPSSSRASKAMVRAAAGAAAGELPGAALVLEETAPPEFLGSALERLDRKQKARRERERREKRTD